MNATATLCAVVLTFAGTLATADPIYRWVDADGLVHYSDVPRDGAEQVELQPAATFSLPPAATAAGSRASTAPEQSAADYEALAIVNPTAEETIWNTGGLVTVRMRPQPSLQPGHSLNLFFNGQPVRDKSPGALTAELQDVARGEHTLTAEILDQNGKRLIAAEPVTFFYRQTSVLNQQNVTNPGPNLLPGNRAPQGRPARPR